MVDEVILDETVIMLVRKANGRVVIRICGDGSNEETHIPDTIADNIIAKALRAELDPDE